MFIGCMREPRKRPVEKKKKLTKFNLIFPAALGGAGALIAFLINFFIAGPPPLEQCITSEDMPFHQHAYLNVTLNGQPFTVPANIGISEDCTRPLHTHDTDGVIHTEMVKPTRLSLADFIKLWGLNLDDYNVKVYAKTPDDIDFREADLTKLNQLVLVDQIRIKMELTGR
jgi:hypothetical protein